MPALNIGLAPLSDAMDAQATAVWTWLSLVRGNPSFPGRLGETTITEYLQAQLWEHWTGQVQYRVPHEPTTGADWEWYIGSSKSKEWICFRVQAKVLSPQHKFSSIGHRVGHAPGDMQMDVLIDSSRINTCFTVPMYAFYIADIPASHPKGPVAWKLHEWRTMRPGSTREHFGCAVVAAETVRLAYQSNHGARNNPDTYLPHSVPWSELFRSLERWVRPTGPKSSATTQRAQLLRLIKILNGTGSPSAPESAALSQDPIMSSWLSSGTDQRRRAGGLPSYAANELEAARTVADSFRATKRSQFFPESERPAVGTTRTSRGTADAGPDPDDKGKGPNHPVVARDERPEGAPRLGMSFLDIDDLPVPSDAIPARPSKQ